VLVDFGEKVLTAIWRQTLDGLWQHVRSVLICIQRTAELNLSINQPTIVLFSHYIITQYVNMNARTDFT